MKPQYIQINKIGDKFYYSDKEMKILHREDGPAVEYVNGGKYWYLNGERHREDGPAMEYKIYEVWYLNGINYSEEEFNKKMKPSKKININGKSFTVEEFNSLIDKA